MRIRRWHCSSAAKRTLRHASKTGRSDPDGLRGAKKAAADHYATEADKARRERDER